MRSFALFEGKVAHVDFIHLPGRQMLKPNAKGSRIVRAIVVPGSEKNLAAKEGGKSSARPVGGHVGDGHSSAGRIGGGEEAYDESKHGRLVKLLKKKKEVRE